MKSYERVLWILIGASAGCGDPGASSGPSAPAGPIGVSTQAMTGTQVTSDPYGVPWVGLPRDSTSGSTGNCTGVQLSEHWVLTAAHCGPEPALRGSRVRYLNGTADATVSHVYVHPFADAALLRLSTRIGKPAKYKNALFQGATSSVSGASVTCMGWGDPNFGVLFQNVPAVVNSVWSEKAPDDVHTVTKFDIRRPSGTGKITGSGDSGGPCFVQDPDGAALRVLGVLGGGFGMNGDGYIAAETFREWASTIMSGEVMPHEVVLSDDEWFGKTTSVLDAPHSGSTPSWMFFPNDILSSIRVGPMAQVELFDHAGFGVPKQALSADSPALSNLGFNNITSSIKVSARPSTGCGIPGPNQVVVWRESGFSGACDRLNPGSFDELTSLNVGESIRAISVGANVTVTLYSEVGYGGTSIPIGASESSLAGKGWNDRARSLRINGRGCAPPGANQVVLWQNDNFLGNCKRLDFGSYANPTQMGFADNDVSSVQVGTNARLGLHEHASFGGRQFHLVSDHAHVRGLPGGAIFAEGHMNDVVSSVRVRPQTDCPAPLATQVVLWENSSFTGRCVVLDVGDYAKPVATAFGLRNDSVTSLKLGAEVTSVTLYEDDFFGGRPVVVQGGNGSAVSVANLSDEPYRFNDQASALKIR